MAEDNGTALHGCRIRRIAPADGDALRAFYGSLSDDSRCRRFLSAGARVGPMAADFFCGPDHRHREGFVAIADGVGRPSIVGHVCLEPAGAHAAEIAVAVADDHQRRGIGRALVDVAIHWARSHAIHRLTASCASDNSGIIRLLGGLHRPITFQPAAAGTIDLDIVLAPEGRGRHAAA